MTNWCYSCKAEIVFDDEHIGRKGKKIPLDPFTKQPHDCPMREKKFSKPIIDDGGSLHFVEEKDDDEHWTEDKDDHGNEETLGQRMVKEFVDHTTAQQAKGQSKVKIFFDLLPSNIEQQYNDFLAASNGKIKTQGAQFRMGQDKDHLFFAIALYYEEVKA